MKRKRYHPMSKWERKFQEFSNWCYETTDTKVAGTALLFVVIANISLMFMIR